MFSDEGRRAPTIMESMGHTVSVLFLETENGEVRVYSDLSSARTPPVPPPQPIELPLMTDPGAPAGRSE